jgi:hypothetical protein
LAVSPAARGAGVTRATLRLLSARKTAYSKVPRVAVSVVKRMLPSSENRAFAMRLSVWYTSVAVVESNGGSQCINRSGRVAAAPFVPRPLAGVGAPVVSPAARGGRVGALSCCTYSIPGLKGCHARLRLAVSAAPAAGGPAGRFAVLSPSWFSRRGRLLSSRTSFPVPSRITSRDPNDDTGSTYENGFSW